MGSVSTIFVGRRPNSPTKPFAAKLHKGFTRTSKHSQTASLQYWWSSQEDKKTIFRETQPASNPGFFQSKSPNLRTSQLIQPSAIPVIVEIAKAWPAAVTVAGNFVKAAVNNVEEISLIEHSLPNTLRHQKLVRQPPLLDLLLRLKPQLWATCLHIHIGLHLLKKAPLKFLFKFSLPRPRPFDLVLRDLFLRLHAAAEQGYSSRPRYMADDSDDTILMGSLQGNYDEDFPEISLENIVRRNPVRRARPGRMDFN